MGELLSPQQQQELMNKLIPIFQQLKMGTLEQKLEIFKNIMPSDGAEMFRKAGNTVVTSDQKEVMKTDLKEACDKFMSSDKGGDSNTLGYIFCCDWFGNCGGGMAAWIIVIIIIVILGCIAAGGAAFFFFYWNRKMGGRDEEEAVEDKEIESEECESKSEHEISVDTY